MRTIKDAIAHMKANRGMNGGPIPKNIERALLSRGLIVFVMGSGSDVRHYNSARHCRREGGFGIFELTEAGRAA
jgi:hypothetical protein